MSSGRKERTKVNVKIFLLIFKQVLFKKKKKNKQTKKNPAINEVSVT